MTSGQAPVAIASLAALACHGLLGGCAARETIPAQPIGVPSVSGEAAQDAAPREEYRLVSPEAYLRSYLAIFGESAPLDVQRRAKAGDGAALFDTWNDYVSALGFADYKLDIPRATQTNALMMATLERLGVALCDRAVEHDLKPKAKAPPLPLAARNVFAFEVPEEVDRAAFAPRFDILHRTFLGYPAALAPLDRVDRYFTLYQGTVARHRAPDAAKSRFTPAQAGWASVCYGLVRHPEFQLY